LTLVFMNIGNSQSKKMDNILYKEFPHNCVCFQLLAYFGNATKMA
jgi:hypothetical protein